LREEGVVVSRVGARRRCSGDPGASQRDHKDAQSGGLQQRHKSHFVGRKRSRQLSRRLG
jgi:hypothetical protein